MRICYFNPSKRYAITYTAFWGLRFLGRFKREKTLQTNTIALHCKYLLSDFEAKRDVRKEISVSGTWCVQANKDLDCSVGKRIYCSISLTLLWRLLRRKEKIEPLLIVRSYQTSYFSTGSKTVKWLGGEPTRRRNDFLAKLNFKRNDLESSQPEGETIFKRNWPIGEFT